MILETTKPDSLSETVPKQGPIHGLTHVTDVVFNFFMLLFKKVNKYENVTFLNLYGPTLFSYILENIENDTEISQAWLNLFDFSNTEEEAYDMQLGVALNLLHDIVCYFVKII